jgi:hypothetical protein
MKAIEGLLGGVGAGEGVLVGVNMGIILVGVGGGGKGIIHLKQPPIAMKRTRNDKIFALIFISLS